MNQYQQDLLEAKNESIGADKKQSKDDTLINLKEQEHLERITKSEIINQPKTFSEGKNNFNAENNSQKENNYQKNSFKNEDKQNSESDKSKNNNDLLNDILNEDDDSSDENNNNKSNSQEMEANEFNEDDEISENERQRILEEELMKSDEEEEDDEQSGKNSSDSSDQQANGCNIDSMSDDSIQDLTNKSIDSGPQDLEDIVDKNNYLPFISQKFEFQNDVLEIIDKNERSFKIVAEKMIQKSSQLNQIQGQDSVSEDGTLTQRRLMHFKEYGQIANRFHGDVRVAQGVPYCIAAIENYIAIGSSDGSIRLFDSKDEVEIKSLSIKEMKLNAVCSLDIKRTRGENIIHAVAGHSKGQIVLYEIKGLPKFYNNKNFSASNSTFRQLKTIQDIHEGQVIQCKFYGEFRKESKEINVVSCDITGCVYLTRFQDTVLGVSCHKQCFWRKRLGGPSFTVCPFFYNFNSETEETLGVFNREGNPYQNKQNAQHNPQQENIAIRNHLVAFGALEKIILTQVSPQPLELFCIDRPDYVDPGIVPYLDWGEGLSPVYRDSTYPILAITWGRTIQLAVWVNFKNIGAKPEIKFDGFYICDGFSIDQCFFLDESLIFVLINKKEVKILYTQRFTPGVFDEKIFQKDEIQNQLANKKFFMQIKDKFTGLVSTYAEVDKGYRLVQKEEIRHKDIIPVISSQLKSKFNFHPTICKNYEGIIIALGKTSVCQGKLIHWEEFLDLTRRTNPNDWLKVLKAAVDIFNGKMVGLAGLPDQKEARENQLRERMKDLLRENIDACIKEFQEGQMVQSKTLRVATEFCIKVGAIDHLFGELFNMFAEAGIEQRYFENLEAFILSGKLRNIQIPQKILTRLIQYYRQKDIELLEKAILNLDLNNYPQNLQLEVRHICEEEFLTSALIHILTTIFDKDKNMENTICLHILCALFNVMNKSKIIKSKEDVTSIINRNKDSTIIFEANQLDERMEKVAFDQKMKERDHQIIERQVKLDIEHSKTYIGYKLMWVIRLFLEGKKFPNGTLSSFKWRMYVFDIVRFITTPSYLSWFLNFDPQRFFKLIQPLYIEQEPFQYIYSQDSFIEMYKDKIPGFERCFDHKQILTFIHQTVCNVIRDEKNHNEGRMTRKSEILENSFIFFISKISKLGPSIQIETELIKQTIIKQLQFHRKLLKFDINIEDLVEPKKMTQGIKNFQQLSQAIQNQKFVQKPEIIEIKNEKDRPQQLYKYLISLYEKDIEGLIKQIEDQVDEETIKEFCKEADHSPIYMVRVYLHQFLHNYQKCLQMFFEIKVIKENVFTWLQDIQYKINHYNQKENIQQQMQTLISKNIGSFIEMNSINTVNLCDQWFDRNYFRMVQDIYKYTPSKSRSEELAFMFINTVLDFQQSKIMSQFSQSTILGESEDNQNQSQAANKFKDLILELTRIVCKKKYRQRAQEYMQRDYFPIDDCLKICEEKGVIDAQAVLYKRKGEFKTSIQLYIQVLTKLSKQKVISALILNPEIPFNDPEIKNVSIRRFDEIIQIIIEICDKDGSRRLKEAQAEELWLYSIEMIYQIKSEVTEETQNISEDDLKNFQIFLLTRIQEFMKRMAEYVQLEKIINFLQKIGKQNTYQEFQPTFEEKVKRETYNKHILENATDLIVKDIYADTSILESLMKLGCSGKNMKCDKCNFYFINKWDQQSVQMFNCGHNFHLRCTVSNNGNCTQCYNQFDGIKRIIQSRLSLKKNKRARGQRLSMRGNQSQAANSSSESDSENQLQSGSSLTESTGSSNYIPLSKIEVKNENQEQEAEWERINQHCSQFQAAVQEREMYYNYYF